MILYYLILCILFHINQNKTYEYKIRKKYERNTKEIRKKYERNTKEIRKKYERNTKEIRKKSEYRLARIRTDMYLQEYRLARIRTDMYLQEYRDTQCEHYTDNNQNKYSPREYHPSRTLIDIPYDLLLCITYCSTHALRTNNEIITRILVRIQIRNKYKTYSRYY
ncbi:hypothetical protein T492DRAFT_196444 [Pavlovales sp. CCMP2436]|nr:hypothetical protein T492DRAFT_196444 [Pavlovales sp. CCMP2436]